MKRYRNYKDSRIEWLGEIPEHWETRRLKYCAIQLTDKAEEYQKKVGLENIISWVGKYIKSDTEYDGEGISFQDDDILFGKLRPYLAKVYLSNFSGSAVGDFFVLRIIKKTTLARYLFYILISKCVINILSGSTFGAKMPRVNWEFFSNLKIPTPSILEQKSIANYLDHKTQQIDTLIEKKLKQIELFKEQRKAIINQAVTKGLNANVKMQDSGIEWLGEIPEHWVVRKTKFLFYLSTEQAPKNNNMELLSLYTEIGVQPRRTLEERGNKASTTDGYWLVIKEDIIVNKLLAWMGAIGVSRFDGVTSPAYDILRKKVEINSFYYDYLFRSGLLLTEFKRNSRGIMEMRLRLYFSELGQIKLPFPPSKEQDVIVKYLDSYTQKADRLIRINERYIEMLKDYRTALISEVVTGKIDVRDFRIDKVECMNEKMIRF